MTTLVHPSMVEAVLDVARDTAGETRARLLHLFREADALTAAAATEHVAEAWCACYRPGETLPPEEWRDLFELAGYTVDGRPAERPGGPLLLFRGAVPECRAGWAWSEDVATARLFEARRSGRVWVALVEPWRLFARMSSTSEREYVVDTAGLLIRLWSP